jgi:hypothetical protein
VTARAAADRAIREAPSSRTLPGTVSAITGSSVTVDMDDGGSVTARCTTKLPVVGDRVRIRRDPNWSGVVAEMAGGFS